MENIDDDVFRSVCETPRVVDVILTRKVPLSMKHFMMDEV
jgi:hypothetical protein